MKKHDLTDLVQKTKTSKSTISRALNHCPGVDPQTRRRILEAAGPQSSSSDADLVMILPDTPPLFLESRLYGAAGGYSGYAAAFSSLLPPL